MQNRLQRAFYYLFLYFFASLISVFYAGVAVTLGQAILDRLVALYPFLEFLKGWVAWGFSIIIVILWVEAISKFGDAYEKFTWMIALKQKAILGYYDYRRQFKFQFEIIKSVFWSLLWITFNTLAPRIIGLIALLVGLTDGTLQAIAISTVLGVGLAYGASRVFDHLFYPWKLVDLVENQASYTAITQKQEVERQSPGITELPTPSQRPELTSDTNREPRPRRPY